MRLLVTRPEPDAKRTAAALTVRGHQVDCAPLLRIEAIADADFAAGPWSGLVITSHNALAAIETHARRAALLRLPVFTVGARTADAARAAGFVDVTEAGGNLAELVAFLRARGLSKSGGRPLLYLAGEDRSGDLSAILAPQGEIVSTVAVYRAAKCAAFPPAVAAALARGAIDGVLHFSRRTAEAYVDCARAGAVLAAALAPTHYCLSGKVAEPLGAAGGRRILLATRPDEAALIALIG
jgi:uroporphyrinogen-III synthase